MSFSSLPTTNIEPRLTGKQCIAFMPTLPGYEAIRATVARAVGSAGFKLRRLEVLLTDPEWQLWLLESLPAATLALVDVTDHNPFVMYELGLVHSRRVPAILCMNSRNARVPATVLGSPFLPYDDEALDSTEDALIRWMRLHAEVAVVPAKSPRRDMDDAGYSLGLALFEQFSADSGVTIPAVSREEYVTRRRVAEGRGDRQPLVGNMRWLALQVLPQIVRNSDETAVMRPLVAWSLSNRPDLVAAVRAVRS